MAPPSTDSATRQQQALSRAKDLAASEGKKYLNSWQQWFDDIGSNINDFGDILGVDENGKNPLQNGWDWVTKILHMIVGWIMGMVDSTSHTHQQATQDNAIKQVDEQVSQFNVIAQSIGLDDAVGKQMHDDCDKAINDAFGFLGISTKPEDAITKSLSLQSTLTHHIHDALLAKYGDRISEETANKIATETAASITGLNLTDLSDADLNNRALRLVADKPTDGLGGLLLSAQSHLESGELTPFSINQASLDKAKQDIAALPTR